jgi:hypothetical protein
MLAPVNPPAAAVATGATPAKKGSVAVQLELLPSGTLTLSGAGDDVSNDTDTAFALGGNLAFAVHPNFSIGFAPRIIFGVQGEGGTETAKEFDLRARAELHGAIAPNAQVFGFVAPGYSFLVMPSDFPADDPSGLVVAFGAGASVDVTPQVFLTGEIGYQVGFQSTSFQGTDVDVTTDFLHLGVGAGTRF